LCERAAEEQDPEKLLGFAKENKQAPPRERTGACETKKSTGSHYELNGGRIPLLDE
jgi:hypothetical protein